MKRIIWTFIICFFASNLFAEESAKVMIVDINYVMGKSKALENVRVELGKIFGNYSNIFSKKEKKLKSLEEELIKQRDTLSKDAFDKKRRAFEQKVLAFRREQQEKKQGLDQAMNEALSKVQKKLLDIIAKTAQEKGANIVVRKELILYAEPDMDQTESLLQKLNKELPKVKVKMPKQDKA